MIENFSPRVLHQFRSGMGHHPRHQSQRASSCVCPPSDSRDRGVTILGFAQTMEHVTGLAWLTGHRSDQPRNQGGPSDPNAGMHAAFALLVGLAERDATQQGCHLEVTMVEGALNAAAELVIEFSAYGHPLERDGNRSPNAAPQGLYRCRGSNEYLAVSVTTDHEWEQLLEVVGPPSCQKQRSSRPARGDGHGTTNSTNGSAPGPPTARPRAGHRPTCRSRHSRRGRP